MMISAAIVLACFALGHAFVVIAGLPVPGAAIGLLLLLATFIPTRGPDPRTSAMFDGLIPHAPVLFVPAGVGLFADPAILESSGFVLVVSVIVGTTVTLAVAGFAAAFALAVIDRLASPAEQIS
jgi:holin-like protein